MILIEEGYYYHGPGQIVGYPIIDLNDWFKDTHKYLRGLEEIIIKTCAEFGITGIGILNIQVYGLGIIKLLQLE